MPANEISDSTGLEISLTWTLTDGNIGPTWADLDLYLANGDIANEGQFSSPSIVNASTSDDSFEKIIINSNLPDGEYSLVIYYFDLGKPGKYSISMKGTASGKMYAINDVRFTVAENSIRSFPAKMTKSGQKFTVEER